MDANLVRRIAFAVVAIPLALGIVYLGGIALTALVAAAGVLGTRELFGFAERQGIRAAVGLGLSAAIAIPALSYAALVEPAFAAWVASHWAAGVALWLLLLLTWALAARGPGDRPLAAVAVTLFGPAYAAGLPSFLLAIRHAEHGDRSWAGAWLVFFPLVVTWVCDTAAMFGGRAIGGPRLAPTVSPGKTRSGAVAGVVGALAVAPVFAALAFEPVGIRLPLWEGLLFAAVLATVGQVGDLAESLLKREVGLKDSSALIPGHGGVLDRFDSLYFVLPAAALLYAAFGVL